MVVRGSLERLTPMLMRPSTGFALQPLIAGADAPGNWTRCWRTTCFASWDAVC